MSSVLWCHFPAVVETLVPAGALEQARLTECWISVLALIESRLNTECYLAVSSNLTELSQRMGLFVTILEPSGVLLMHFIAFKPSYTKLHCVIKKIWSEPKAWSNWLLVIHWFCIVIIVSIHCLHLLRAAYCQTFTRYHCSWPFRATQRRGFEKRDGNDWSPFCGLKPSLIAAADATLPSFIPSEICLLFFTVMRPKSCP